MIKNLIEIELGYINTNHPDFIGGMLLVWNEKILFYKKYQGIELV